MDDFYRILDVHHLASLPEIREAYLAKMKALHPDLRPIKIDPSVGASDVTYAYWHLRDPRRRAEHDRDLIKSTPPLRRQQLSSKRMTAVRNSAQKTAFGSSPPLKRMRAAAGVAAFAVAGAATSICFTYLPVRDNLRYTQPLKVAAGPGDTLAAATKQRRKVDATLAMAAAKEFSSVVSRTGGTGAHQYARQCLAEVAAAQRLTVLDYCLAFENSGALWERSTFGSERYFADQQRQARYSSLAESMAGGPAREDLMQVVKILAESGP